MKTCKTVLFFFYSLLEKLRYPGEDEPNGEDRIATRVVKRYQAYPVYLPWQEPSAREHAPPLNGQDNIEGKRFNAVCARVTPIEPESRRLFTSGFGRSTSRIETSWDWVGMKIVG